MPRRLSRQGILVAADAVIFTVLDGRLQVLLIQMKKRPFTGQWAFPGGLLADGQTAEAAARQILRQQAGVGPAYLEQLMTFDAPRRDPLGRVVSVAYFALVPAAGLKLRTTDKYAAVRWWPVTSLPRLAYDHRHLADVALARLRAKLGYTSIVWSVLPQEFSLGQLLEVYEAILGRRLDKRNFLKKITSFRLITPTGQRTVGGAHRPAALYRFRERRPALVDLL